MKFPTKLRHYILGAGLLTAAAGFGTMCSMESSPKPKLVLLEQKINSIENNSFKIADLTQNPSMMNTYKGVLREYQETKNDASAVVERETYKDEVIDRARLGLSVFGIGVLISCFAWPSSKQDRERALQNRTSERYSHQI